MYLNLLLHMYFQLHLIYLIVHCLLLQLKHLMLLLLLLMLKNLLLLKN